MCCSRRPVWHSITHRRPSVLVWFTGNMTSSIPAAHMTGTDMGAVMCHGVVTRENSVRTYPQPANTP
jgi:hypothetical protein